MLRASQSPPPVQVGRRTMRGACKVFWIKEPASWMVRVKTAAGRIDLIADKVELRGVVAETRLHEVDDDPHGFVFVADAEVEVLSDRVAIAP